MLSLELYFINQCENRIKAFSEMSEDKVFCYVLLFKGLLKDFFQKIECIKDYICDPRTVDPQEREREAFRHHLGDRRESKHHSLEHRGQNFERLQD